MLLPTEKRDAVLRLSSKDNEVDVAVHLYPNDLYKKDILSVKDFQSLGQEFSRIACNLTFSEVLSVYKQKDQCIAD